MTVTSTLDTSVVDIDLDSTLGSYPGISSAGSIATSGGWSATFFSALEGNDPPGLNPDFVVTTANNPQGLAIGGLFATTAEVRFCRSRDLEVPHRIVGNQANAA